MIGVFFLAVVVLIGLALFLRWAAHADPALLKRLARIAAIALILLGAVFLFAVGRAAFGAGLLGLLIPLLIRRRPRIMAGATAPDRSEPEPAMTVEEALGVLGLRPGATETEIREAYRHRMEQVQKDRGGSPWAAAEINQARDVLLGS